LGCFDKIFSKSNKVNQVELNNEIAQFLEKYKGGKLTPEQVKFIQRYEGSGGQGSKGAKGEGVLYEFYTPDFVVDLMWELAYHHGFKDDETILEPSIATGRLIRPAKDYSKVVGFEINPISAKICRLSYPGCEVIDGYFEKAFLQPPRYTIKVPPKKVTWLEQYPFGMVIGNPPYGIYKNLYSSYFDKKLFKQIEIFFIYQGLRMLKPGGLLVYLISSNFMRNGDKYDYAKQKIGEIAELTDAYRLPKVFAYSDVPTDILILRKK
jgi:type I restriction-modification system DNA methylase subunit